jgi:hypothetical protein
MDLWLDAMDWPSIEELALESVPEALRNAGGQLHSLRNLESTDLPFIQALPKNSLTQLSWVGTSEYTDLPSILEAHGKTLQSLEFHCPELLCPSFHPSFNADVLPKRTQNLTHLSVNIHRNGTWPLETLETIAAISKLRKADLWMGIQSECRQQYEDYTRSQIEMEREFGTQYCKGEDQFQSPFLKETNALELFEYMRQKK